MAETNVMWTYENAREMCTTVLRNYWSATKISTSSSGLGSGKIYQPGGTMTIIGNDWTSRATMNSDRTALGRWTECTISGKCSRHVTFITAYNVCNDNIATSGATTAFTQQYHLLKLANPHATPNPRQQFLTDLRTRINKLKSDGHEIVVMLDANDTLQNHQSTFTSWVRSVNLVDVHMHFHGTDDEPATHSRGSNRIDYILATPVITDYIENCGILPFHEICYSDHRALYADFDLVGYLGGHAAHSLQRQQRGVTTADPRTVRKYQKYMEQALNDSDLEDKIEKVQLALQQLQETQADTSPITSLVEDIDVQFLAMRLECEKRCRSKHNLPWSPKLRDAYHNQTFWATWISELKSNKRRDFHQVRVRYATSTTHEFLHRTDISLKEAYYHHKAARRALDEVKLKAKEFRETFLEERAKMAQDSGDVDLATIINAIKRAEARQRIFQKLKRIKGKFLTSGIDHVIQVAADGTQSTIHDSDALFAAIIERNRTHFSQAAGTPFTIEPLASLLGPYATSQFASDLLQGTVDVTQLSVSDATKAILDQLKQQTSKGTIPIDISTEDVINGYMKWGEFTSTSPSGAHLGHDKAMLKMMQTQDKEAFKAGKLPPYRRFFQIKAFLMNTAVQLGHVYERWTKVVNALIEKIPGLPLLHKLRVIHLIESDFNLLIGILWGRRLIWEAEDKHILHDGQGGSRPDRRTQEQVIQKHSVLSILRMSQMNGSTFDNDAKSCYDRIVMPLASLCAQQVGMPPLACELFLKTLRKMHYHVKTSHGISEQAYRTTADTTIHGPGQGGRGSPAVWVTISSILMHCMEEYCTGAKLLSPFDPKSDLKFWITGFVDDVTHWCTHWNRQDEAELCSDLQHAAQWWEQLLHASGGKLELSKCFFYIIMWRFDEEGVPRLQPPDKFQYIIDIRDSETGEVVQIPHRACSEPHKTLGVMETPDGSNSAEFNRLLKLCNSHAQRVATGRMSRIEAQEYYQSTFLSSMSYGMVIGTMNKDQLDKIQGATRLTFLSAMGYNRCSPIPVAYGPKALGGLGIQDLFARQGTEKVVFLLRLLRTNKTASKTLRLQLEWAQLLSGLSQSIFEDVTTKLPQLCNERWITTLREFLAKSQLCIRIPNFCPNQLLRENDSYIMDHTTGMSTTEIAYINRCRIYLRAITIADIATISGSHLTTSAYRCMEDAQGIAYQSWPKQPRPGPRHRAAWTTFLHSLCSDKTTSKLRHPMGKWNAISIRHVQSTEIFIDHTRHLVYRMNNAEWTVDAIVYHRKYCCAASNPAACDPPDITTLVPAEIHRHGVTEHLVWTPSIVTTITTPIQISDWAAYVDALDEWRRELIQHHTILCDIEFLEQILSDPSAHIDIVSDGSSDTSQTSGTYGWVLAYNGDHLVTGFGGVPGFPVSSFRSEGFGKLAWLVFLNEFCYAHDISCRCGIQSYCDNQGIVNRTKCHFHHQQLSHTVAPSFDVLREIALQQQDLQLTTNTVYVKGHQDRVKNAADLTVPEQLNIDADHIAGAANAFFKKRGNKVHQYELPSCGPYLLVDGKAMWSGETEILRWRYAEFQLQDYYTNSFNISKSTLFDINWAGLRIARQSLTPGIQNFSLKFGINWLATGTVTQRYGNVVNECILCGGEEDNLHLLLCPHRLQVMQEAMKQFHAYLREINTEPQLIITLIIHIHKSLVLIPDAELLMPTNKLYHDAVKSQAAIGWHRFVRGYISHSWATIQEHHLIRSGSSQLGDSWSAKVSLWWIRKSFEIWTARNNCIHQNQPGLQNRMEEEVLAQVQRLYEQTDSLSAADREILDMPLQQRLQQPIASLKQWLSVVTPTIRTCIRSFSERLQTSNQSITSFLSTVTSMARPEQASTPSAETTTTLITSSMHDNTTPVAINRTYASSDKNVLPSDSSHRAKSWQSRLRHRDKHGKVTPISSQHRQSNTEDKRDQSHTKTRTATVSLFLPWRDVRYRDQDATLSAIREQNKSEATLDVCTNDSQESLSPCEK